MQLKKLKRRDRYGNTSINHWKEWKWQEYKP